MKNINTSAIEKQPSITGKEIKILLVAALLAMLSLMGTDIHLASMPFIMKYLHTSKEVMQQSISVYFLGMGLSTFFWGPFSDKHGRRPALALCLVIFIAGSAMAVFAQHAHWFLLARVIQGLGAGGFLGVARSVVVDVLAGPRMSTIGSYFSMIIALSPLLAPMVGGYLQHWFGWQANFIVLALLGILLLLALYVFSEETNTTLNPDSLRFGQMLYNYKTLLKSPVFVVFTLCSGLAISVNAAYAATSSFILQGSYHISPIAYGWITVTVGAMAMGAKFLNAKLAKRIGIHETLRVGFLCVLIAGIAVLVMHYVGWLPILPLMLFVLISILGQNLIAPNATSGALSPFKHIAGASGALFGSAQMLISFVSSAIIASLAGFGVSALSGAYVVIGVIGIIAFALVLNGHKQSAQKAKP